MKRSRAAQNNYYFQRLQWKRQPTAKKLLRATYVYFILN